MLPISSAEYLKPLELLLLELEKEINIIDNQIKQPNSKDKANFKYLDFLYFCVMIQ